ncbi:hypothetical protein [Maridesulfovibrio hydrothermalis]|uniref:Uncharacterized protein n=1 Tax=Maridesulfovibrio hydrothermalis AM13 = DSM 14728 TaxID=1121451 RepID=L0RE89_9BACT|nr:hypothetical protein [Maridesulfovibrio hydrothermalis]CCO24522.1 conserved protein of unknown function [Maridesulfovibrio hydrothermalis AM13 = DSM 14728]
MVLNERHMQLLKHIKSYSGIKRYHGLLPKLEAALYEFELIDELLEYGLIEEGSICTSCGNNLEGYRISRKAEKEFEKKGIDIKDSDWESFCCIDVEIDEYLDKEHIRALMDIFYLSRVAAFRGIAPKRILHESYTDDILSVLLDVGFIYKISLKGPTIHYRHGFVLSDKASRMLQQVGYVK